MYFKFTSRNNPLTQKTDVYCRLVESYRNAEDRICHRTVINVGFMPDAKVEQLNKIQRHLTLRAEGKIALFEENDPVVLRYITTLWERMISEKRIDLPEEWIKKQKKLVDADTIEHRQVREIGIEWLSLQALEELQLDKFFEKLGWSSEQIQLTMTQIVSRAAYPASELKTSRWIKENSAICDLTHYPVEKLTKDKLYQNAIALYQVKDALEQHLSARTNELFDLEDRIMLYDLTNTYFEGRKVNSQLAKFGRSKEKRSDAKIIVLALVVNPQGFLKYSNVFEGNTSDSQTLPDMVDKLRIQTSDSANKAIVVMDAGIATEHNLALLDKKGYYYLCVSRSQLKDYQVEQGAKEYHVTTNNREVLSLTAVKNAANTDYYVKVKSPGKRAKETAMKQQFESRFDEELKKIQQSVSKKYASKKLEVINRRIGRALSKYPSVSQYYDIEVESDSKNENATQLTWQKKEDQHAAITEKIGVYFIRTNMPAQEEITLWKIYNTIREIESTFRTLKTDLDLRPIYHKSDQATLAHLHLGLLGYWLVNTIRHKLKKEKINHDWTEIVRIANTQKLVTTTAINQLDQQISITKASKPEESLHKIYQALKYKSYTLKKLKSVVHKPPEKNPIDYKYQLVT